MKHVLGMMDLEDHMADILDLAAYYKQSHLLGSLPQDLAGKTVVVIFEKPSTRTRISFELGVKLLGGHVSILDAGSSQLSRGESIEDTAGVLGRYADCIVHRAKNHATLAATAQYAGTPVVNALTDLEHPCQVLADWLALQQAWGNLAGRKLAYIGDGNNMCHSYLLGAPLVGMDISVATPPGYEPDAAIVNQALALAAQHGTSVTITHNPIQAATGADAVATDTWTSMGDEATRHERLEAFNTFTVDRQLMGCTNDGLFLHCLPGHWGEEATHDVAHGPRSLILDQAENRMWVQMAVLATLTRPHLTQLGQKRLSLAA